MWLTERESLVVSCVRARSRRMRGRALTLFGGPNGAIRSVGVAGTGILVEVRRALAGRY